MNKESPDNNDLNFPFAIGFSSGTVLLTQFVSYENYREFYLDLWCKKGRLAFLQEGLLSANYPLKNHRFSQKNFEIASDEIVVNLMDQNYAMYNLYDHLFRRINAGDFNNKNLDSSLDVVNIIKKLELSMNNKDERIFL